MIVAYIKFDDNVIVEIDKSSLSFVPSINKKNFMPLMIDNAVYSSLPRFRKERKGCLKMAVLTSLVWLKQNSKHPIEKFFVVSYV